MKNRLLSLDVFRGMTVFFMIIVNTTGNWSATYAPLLHAKWHGFTPTDLVFPSFLFAVGASLAIVMEKWKTSFSAKEVHRKILKRTFLIFLLGFLLYWFPFFDWKPEGNFVFRPLGETRIMGVLQRIALSYGIAALILYHFSLSNTLKITLGILIGYWLILLGFGDLSMAGNAANLFDLKILGANHLYKGEGIPFDPEGLLSTLPCIGNVVAGFAITKWMRAQPKDYSLLFRLSLLGTALIAIACLWHYALPINKKLWTSSYVLLTSGINILMLLALHYLLDLQQSAKGLAAFFTPMGKNPLFIYVLSQVAAILLGWIPNTNHGSLYNASYQFLFRPFGDHFGAFLFALTFTFFCWAVAKQLDHQKHYLKI